MTQPEAITRVACVGTGTIGSAWVAHFLRRGYEVCAWDPAEDAEPRLRAAIDNAWPTLEALGLAAGADPGRLRVSRTLESALEEAEFVQESVPENIPTKTQMLARIDAAAPADTVIASSTSGFSMSDMQGECRHPERTVVGHPFHPVYMIPLVEVAGGDKTDEASVDWCVEFYRQAGKSPVKVRDRVHGFIANRLQSALWNEALHMVAAGEATVADIDRAVSEGPGLRWALMGPSFTFHLAGGPDGIGGYMSKFADSLSEPYSRLSPPPFDATLQAALIDGCHELAAGKSLDTLSAERDQFLIDVLRAKSGKGPR